LNLDPSFGDFFVSGNIIPSVTPNEFAVAFTSGQTTSSFVAVLRKDYLPEGEETLTLAIQPSANDYIVRVHAAGGMADTRHGKGRGREHNARLLGIGPFSMCGAAMLCIPYALQ
jgi:hypothetical protein